MRRPIGQRGLDRQPIDAGAEQRLPEIALEAVLQEIGRAHAARGQRLLSQHDGDQLAAVPGRARHNIKSGVANEPGLHAVGAGQTQQ